MIDPEQLFVDYEAKLDEAQLKAEQVRAGLNAVTATERSADGQVTVTVNASGNVTDLQFGPGGRSGPELAEVVLHTMRRAQNKLTGAVRDHVPPTVGAAIMDELTTQYGRMYPPPPEPPRGPRRTLRLGGEPENTPPGQQRSRRPAEPRDEGDYSDRGLLR